MSVKFKTNTLLVFILLFFASSLTNAKNLSNNNWEPIKVDLKSIEKLSDGNINDWPENLKYNKVSYEKLGSQVKYTIFRNNGSDYLLIGYQDRGYDKKFSVDKVAFGLSFLDSQNKPTKKACQNYNKTDNNGTSTCDKYIDTPLSNLSLEFYFSESTGLYALDDVNNDLEVINKTQYATHYDGEFYNLEVLVPIKLVSADRPYLTTLVTNRMFDIDESKQAQVSAFRSDTHCKPYCPHPTGWVEPSKIGAIQMGFGAQGGNGSLGTTITSNLEDVVIAGEGGTNIVPDGELTMSLIIYNTTDVRAIAEGPAAVISGGPFVLAGIEGVYVQSLNSDVWGVGVAVGFIGLPGADMSITSSKIIKHFNSREEFEKMIARFSDPEEETCGLDVPWELLRGLRLQIPSWGNKVIEVPSTFYSTAFRGPFTAPACRYKTISSGWINWMKTDPDYMDIFNTNDKVIYLDVLARESWCDYRTENHPKNKGKCHLLIDINPMLWPDSYGFAQAIHSKTRLRSN
jgi:hypothetical protein